MATLTLTATTSQGTLTNSVTLTDADAARILIAYGKAHGPPLGPLGASPTNAQIFAVLAKTFWQGLKSVVVQQEAIVVAPPVEPTLT